MTDSLVTNLLAELNGAMSALPEGANPYQAIRRLVRQALAPSIPSSFGVPLWVLAAALAVCLLFVLGSLGVRIWYKGFWIVRANGPGGLWRPHWSISWSMFAVVLVALLEVQIWKTRNFYGEEAISKDFLHWRILPWISGWMGGWVAAWSLAVSYFTHLSGRGGFQSLGRFATPLNFGLAVLVPAVYLAAVLPFAMKACISYRQVIDIVISVDGQLADLETSWMGETFSLLNLVPMLADVNDLPDRMQGLVTNLKNTFLVYGISAVFLLVALDGIAIPYLHSIRMVIEGGAASFAQPSQSQDVALRNTYLNLKMTILLFSAMAFGFGGVCFAIAARPMNSSTSALMVQVTTLLPLYIFAVSGVPTSILLFIRSFDAGRQTSPVSSTRATATTMSVAIGGRAAKSIDFETVATGQYPPLSSMELQKLGTMDSRKLGHDGRASSFSTNATDRLWSRDT